MSLPLEVRGVSKSFGGVAALSGVSFDLQAGEVHALVGENGAGKSTLIKVITGVHEPDEGIVLVGGEPLGRADPLRARQLGIAPIYQQPSLFPELSVSENLALGLETGGALRRIDWPVRRRRAEEMLARVGAHISPDAPAGSLRMAEQQLVEIARALGSRARVLLMDEPTAALAQPEVERLLALVAELRAQGTAIVYISHRLEELGRVADRVTVLRDGRVVATRPMAEVGVVELIRLMVGREVLATYPDRGVPGSDTVLEVRGLSCRAAGVHDASFGVRAGEVLGLAGLVGSGRTELARVLYGITPADAGEIRLRGRAVHVASPAEAVALGIAYVPEDRRRHGVVGEMSVGANVTLTVLDRIARYGLIDRAAERQLATGYVERFAVKTPSLETPVAALSGGNQQKVALARALATRPAVLILDEPTQGVDVGAKAEIHRLVVELAAQGLAIVLISSELTEVLGLSHRIAVVRGGTLVALREREQTHQEDLLSLAFGQAGLPTPQEASH